MVDDVEADYFVRQVVRGERPWDDLSTIGVFFERGVTNGSYQVQENAHGMCVIVSVTDIIAGFRAQFTQPDRLRAWAVMMNASGVWDYEPAVDDEPATDIVRDALMGAAFGEPLSTEMLELIG